MVVENDADDREEVANGSALEEMGHGRGGVVDPVVDDEPPCRELPLPP